MEGNYNWQGKTILVVDDEYMNCLLFEAMLKDTRLTVIHAMNGQIAIDKCLDNDNIDLVLMDIKMPAINGYDVIKAIKRKRRDLPIIAQTAFTASEDYYKCINAGFDDYIAKPIERDLLLYKLSTFLN